MARKTVTIRGESVRLWSCPEFKGWNAFQGDDYFEFRRDVLGTGWEMSTSPKETEHDPKNVVARGATIQDAANNHMWAQRGKEITAEVVCSAAALVISSTGSQEFTLRALVERVSHVLRIVTGEQFDRVVRIVRDELHPQYQLFARARELWVVRYPDSLVAAWAEADRLASELGGRAEHHTAEGSVKITLTLEQALALVARHGER